MHDGPARRVMLLTGTTYFSGETSGYIPSISQHAQTVRSGDDDTVYRIMVDAVVFDRVTRHRPTRGRHPILADAEASDSSVALTAVLMDAQESYIAAEPSARRIVGLFSCSPLSTAA